MNKNEISACFDINCEIFDDYSTEFIIQVTADIMGCKYEDVIDSITEEKINEKKI